MIRAVSGVYPLPPECFCGAEATTRDLDGDRVCEACAQSVGIAHRVWARARELEDAPRREELRAARLAAAIAAGCPPWWWAPREDH